jgi:ABC-2 type transport system permease protein
MMKFLSVFSVTFKQWFRSPATVFFSILFPLVLLLIFGFVFAGIGSGTTSIYIQNQDVVNGTSTPLSSAYIDALNHTNVLDISLIPSGVDARSYAQNLSSNQFFSSYRILIIPPGFQNETLASAYAIRLNTTYDTLNSTLSDFAQFIPPNDTAIIQAGLGALKSYAANATVGNVTLTFLSDPSDTNALIARGIINSVAMAFNSQLVGGSSVINTQDQSLNARSLTSVDYYLPGLIAAFVMTNGIFGLTNITADLRKRGVIRRLLSTPLTKLDWILGNILTQVVIGLMLTLVMILFAFLVFRVVAIPDAFTLLAVAIGVVAFSGLGMIFGGLVKNVETSSALANVVAFPMMFLSGSFFPTGLYPPIIQSISYFIPLTYFSNALRSTLITKDMTGIVFNLGILSVIAVVFIGIGVWAIRWKEN